MPDSGVKQKVLLQMDEEQQFLVNMIQNEISKRVLKKLKYYMEYHLK